MVQIENYLNDGANWQAVCVLAYLRSHFEPSFYNENSSLYVGRFENCREQGYVFVLRVGYQLQRNYVVYEHRNIDGICIKIFDEWTINTPTLEECMKHFADKWDYNKDFACGLIVDAAKYIIEDMKSFLSNHNI